MSYLHPDAIIPAYFLTANMLRLLDNASEDEPRTLHTLHNYVSGYSKKTPYIQRMLEAKLLVAADNIGWKNAPRYVRTPEGTKLLEALKPLIDILPVDEDSE